MGNHSIDLDGGIVPSMAATAAAAIFLNELRISFTNEWISIHSGAKETIEWQQRE